MGKRCISLRSIRSPIFNKNKRYPRLTVPILRTNTFQTRPFTNTTTKMSFSNADTGSKNADPYKATNKDETSIQEKVEDLSGKTNDIDSDSHINISFLNSSGEWASVSGKASIVTDRDTVKKYYSPALKAWLGDLGDGKHDG